MPSATDPGDIERPALGELTRPLLAVGAMVAVMWAVEIIDLVPGTNLDRWGIRPRTLRGLLGIAFAPFLHSGFPHLIANTIPFVVLGLAIAFGSVARFGEVVLIVGVVSGLGTWLVAGSNTVHIGASGLVFGFVTYLVARGVFARHLLWLLGGVVVLVIYGGILWGVLPRPGISWTGHLFGAVGGVAAGWILHGQQDSDAPPA